MMNCQPDMIIKYTAIFLSGFFLSLAGIFLTGKALSRRDILVQNNTPLTGGIGVAAAFFAVLACFGGLASAGMKIASASFIMLIFGVIDDRRELGVSAKFVVQAIAASFLVFSGIRAHIVYIGEAANIIISYLWIIGMINAINLLDVMDGVAGGVSLISAAAFFLISLLHGDVNTAVISLAFAASVAGFLVFNFPPAKVYMGNSGSHFMGLVLAAISLSVSYAGLENKIGLLSPLLIMGFPIFDTTFLVMARIAKGRSAFNKSEDHLVLRFLKIGYSKKKALFTMLFTAFLLSFCGVLLCMVSTVISVSILVFTGVLMAVLAYKMFRVGCP